MISQPHEIDLQAASQHDFRSSPLPLLCKINRYI